MRLLDVICVRQYLHQTIPPQIRQAVIFLGAAGFPGAAAGCGGNW